MDVLCARAKKGDKGAMERIFARYRPLMVNLARQWPTFWFEDALQEAHIAVMEAVRDFDPAVGCYFGVFIRQRIRSRLRTWGRRQVRWAERNVSASYHRDDVEEEGVPIEDWADEKAGQEWMGLQWDMWMKDLSPRERLVIQRQVKEGYRLAEIATQEKVSRHTVQTWKKRAMQKLRKNVANDRKIYFG